jgi:glycosyl transferase family 25
MYIRNRPKSIPLQDIWVINLEKDLDRWTNIRKDTNHIRWMIHRWQATKGAEIKKSDAHMEGVSQMMILQTAPHDIYYKKTEIDNNAGKVGCWLSHKRLLTYLSNLQLPDDHAHLIVEDDIHFHNGFLEEWHNVSKKIPTDWDMVYLGINYPNLKNPVEKPVYRGTTLHVNQGNWGTQAYMVKHGSLKTRILPKLRYMSHEIDVQFNLYFNEMNVYILYPNILHLHEELSKTSSVELK